jgi:hypothetical protein
VPAALTPTGAVLAAGVALVLVGRRRIFPVAAALLAFALPWIVAGALHPTRGISDPAGVAAFAARAEGWGGSLLAVLGTGGIWNAGAVPGSRASAMVPVLTLAMVGLAVVGWSDRSVLRGPGLRLVLLGGVGLALALAATVPGVRDLMEAAVRTVPGAGLLRDGQKWVAWWALPLAVGAGVGARRLAQGVRASSGGAVGAGLLAAAAVLLPLVALPDLVWGVGGRLHPVAYPADWQRVRAVLADDPGPGDVLVLPFGAYRAFGWNADRPQLDPAARWLTRPVVADDELVVGGRAVAGEDARARTVGAAAGDPAALAELGVGWVLVERGTAGRPVPPEVTALPLVVGGEALDLYRVPGARPGPVPSPGRVTAVVGVHAWALGTMVGTVLWATTLPSSVTLRRRPRRKEVSA